MKTQTITVVNSKKETQKQITALRAAGLTVIKDSGGAYSCDIAELATEAWLKENDPVLTRLFTAMPGRNGYLIRRVANLFG